MILFAKKLIDQSLVLEEQITPIVTAYLNNVNKKRLLIKITLKKQ